MPSSRRRTGPDLARAPHRIVFADVVEHLDVGALRPGDVLVGVGHLTRVPGATVNGARASAALAWVPRLGSKGTCPIGPTAASAENRPDLRMSGRRVPPNIGGWSDGTESG